MAETNQSQLIRVPDDEALSMIRILAEQDLRSMGAEVAWLIRQEYARRYSQPNPSVTLAEAVEAGESVRK
ncbi:MAG: hypothetical protein QMD04_10735 [Anaerolineales bacterium]|nr:hypothetical protein [Anaerolineales bacterium]